MSYFTCNETFSFDLSSCRNRNEFNSFKINSKAALGLRMRAERRAQSIQSEAKYGLNLQPEFAGYGWYGVVASIEACGAKPFLFSKKRKVYSLSKRENSNLDCALQRALGPGSTPGTGPQSISYSELLHHRFWR